MEQWAYPLVILLISALMRLWAGATPNWSAFIESFFKFPLDVYTVTLAVLASASAAMNSELPVLLLLISIGLMFTSRVVSIWSLKKFISTPQGQIDIASSAVCIVNYIIVMVFTFFIANSSWGV